MSNPFEPAAPTYVTPSTAAAPPPTPAPHPYAGASPAPRPPPGHGSPAPTPGSERATSDGSFVWHRQEKAQQDPFNPTVAGKISGVFWGKGSEAAHFLIALAMIFGLALTIFLSWMNQGIDQRLLPWQGVLLLAGFYTSGFFLHELGHRQVAKRHNLPTKFRLLSFGLVLTVVGYFTPLKIGIPGAVLVVGLEEINDRTGQCKVAGPLVNLVLGFALFGLSFLPLIPAPYNFFFGMGAYFNFMLGGFNLLPVGPLDGRNIIKWKPGLWGALMLVMWGMFVFLMLVLSVPDLTEALYHLSDLYRL